MESIDPHDETDLVRCLECGTVYSRPVADDLAEPCPSCGYVGWIALAALQTSDERQS